MNQIRIYYFLFGSHKTTSESLLLRWYLFVNVYIYICVCVCVCVCVKTSGKWDKRNTYNGFSSDISFLMHLTLPSLDHLSRWSHSKKINPTTITQTSIYFPSLFFLYLSLVFWSFPSLYIFIFYHLLKCRKTQNVFVWRNSSLNKEQNITSKPVVRV